MRLDVLPLSAEATPGRPVPITITITNTSGVIGGYQVRFLGADPTWIALPAGQISLFPDESTTLTAMLTVPAGITAGTRRVAVQVHELTPPHDTAITEIDLSIPAAPSVAIRVDPPMVHGGRSAAFTVLVENKGNTVIRGFLDAEDEEAKVRFRFSPERLALAPGEHTIVDLTARARRRVFGSPTPRPISLYLEERGADAFLDDVDADLPPPADRTPLAMATMLQKPLIGRGSLSLLGLLAAITVFAVMITLALSRLVGQSAADRDLAIRVAQARDLGTQSGTARLTGTVRTPSGGALEGVSVALYGTTNSSVPITTTATDKNGSYVISGLVAAQYKLLYRAAGFVPLWFPGATADTDASVLSVKDGETLKDVDMVIGGAPATIRGHVEGDDVGGATLYLRATPVTPLRLGTRSNSELPNDGMAVVQTIPVGSDGAFDLENVPSPAHYQLYVTKAGYAAATTDVDVRAGETRADVEIRLQKGDGRIEGSISTGVAGLGGATVIASNGQTTASAVSQTKPAGHFVVENLPTPATYTLTVTYAGYAPQTLTVTLAAGQRVKGVDVTLVQASASLRGDVYVARADAAKPVAAGGVSVTITDGQLTVQTVSHSFGADIGDWEAGGLPVPGQYTVTFARSDLLAQTMLVSLDEGGNVVRDPGDTTNVITTEGRIVITMQPATAVVHGHVVQQCLASECATTHCLGEGTVTLNSGAQSYAVSTASVTNKTGSCGDFRIENVPPGTYTLTIGAGPATLPYSSVVQLAAGQDKNFSTITLAAPARLQGCVLELRVSACPANASEASAARPRTGWVVTLYQVDQYPTTALATTRTDDLGSFAFDSVGAGQYVIEVGPGPDNPVKSATVTVRPSKLASSMIVVPEQ